MSGMLAPVRDERPDLVGAWLAVELPLLAKQYGNRVELPDHLLGECLDLIFTRFKHLSKNEIREAYRMWASGDLGELPAAEMYGGTFQARHLGAILKAYSDVRGKVMFQLVTESERLKYEHDQAASHEMKQKQVEEWFVGHVADIKGKVESWESVPEFWYDMSRRLGLFTLTSEEGHAILAEAHKLTHQTLKKELADGATGARRKYLINILNPESEAGAGAILEQAKKAARKITVFRKLLQ